MTTVSVSEADAKADMLATVKYEDAQTLSRGDDQGHDRPGLPGGGLEAHERLRTASAAQGGQNERRQSRRRDPCHRSRRSLLCRPSASGGNRGDGFVRHDARWRRGGGRGLITLGAVAVHVAIAPPARAHPIVARSKVQRGKVNGERKDHERLLRARREGPQWPL